MTLSRMSTLVGHSSQWLTASLTSVGSTITGIASRTFSKRHRALSLLPVVGWRWKGFMSGSEHEVTFRDQIEFEARKESPVDVTPSDFDPADFDDRQYCPQCDEPLDPDDPTFCMACGWDE